MKYKHTIETDGEVYIFMIKKRTAAVVAILIMLVGLPLAVNFLVGGQAPVYTIENEK